MNILVALDLSSKTHEILDQAKSLAMAYKSKLWILHVAEPDPEFVGYKVGPQSVRDSVAEIYHKEHRQIQSYADAIREQGIEVTPLLIQGHYAETILDQSDKLSADMIVIGSHGKGIVAELILGSVSEPVIRHSKVPVLVVPTHRDA